MDSNNHNRIQTASDGYEKKKTKDSSQECFEHIHANTKG